MLLDQMLSDNDLFELIYSFVELSDSKLCSTADPFSWYRYAWLLLMMMMMMIYGNRCAAFIA